MTKAKTTYRVRASRDELRLDLDENFWNDTIITHPSVPPGTTQLDINIRTVLQEIKVALYYVGTEGTKH